MMALRGPLDRRRTPLMRAMIGRRHPVFRSAAAMPAIERSSGGSAALVAAAVAPEQLDLDRVHRVDVRIAQAHRPLHDRMAVEQVARPRRSRARRRPCARARRRSAPTGARRRRARGTRARSPCSTSRASSRGSARACGRTATRGRAAAARLRSVSTRTRVPQPYHAGSRQRFCVHAKTHGIARSEPTIVLAFWPPRRPRADVEQRELLDRRERAEEVDEARVVDERAVDAACARRRAASTSSSAPAGGSTPLGLGAATSSVAASAASRFRYASPGRPYLNAIVSPCSVSFRRPGGSPCGCARIASYVGPPPRPALPPRPWKTVRLDAAPPRDVGERDERAADLPLRGEVAGVLRRVRVADHHLAAADRRRAAPRRSGARRAARRPTRRAARPTSGSASARARGARRRPTMCRRRSPCRAPRPCRSRGSATASNSSIARRAREVARVHAHVEPARGASRRARRDGGARASVPSAIARAAVRAQAAVEHVEVVRELVGRRVGVGVEAAPDERELAPVGLVDVLVADRRGVVARARARRARSTRAARRRPRVRRDETPIVAASARTSSR